MVPLYLHSLHIYDDTNHCLCGTGAFTIEKNLPISEKISADKWVHAVQTHAVQGSAVVKIKVFLALGIFFQYFITEQVLKCKHI